MYPPLQPPWPMPSVGSRAKACRPWLPRPPSRSRVLPPPCTSGVRGRDHWRTPFPAAEAAAAAADAAAAAADAAAAAITTGDRGWWAPPPPRSDGRTTVDRSRPTERVRPPRREGPALPSPTPPARVARALPRPPAPPTGRSSSGQNGGGTPAAGGPCPPCGGWLPRWAGWPPPTDGSPSSSGQ